MTRAWIYGRVSSEDQRESGAGIAAGSDACRAFALRQGWEVGGEFTDEGVSGATGLDKRPALLEAITAMRKGDMLLVAKRDRLGRDPIAVAMIEAAVKRKGGRVVSAAGEGTESDDPTAILMRRIVDAFSEYERLIIKARTKAGMQAKRRRGERVGQLPYGADVGADGVRLVENEGELAAVAVVYELRGRGLSLQAVAEKLNEMGIPTKKEGARWHTTQVFRLLKRTAVPIAS
jgi:DNA invertase Pin-like site-specific DNA recombinase